jgi:hypothetical protein
MQFSIKGGCEYWELRVPLLRSVGNQPAADFERVALDFETWVSP